MSKKHPFAWRDEMQGEYKPFSEANKLPYDARAKAAVAQELNDDGLYCHVNDDLYGPDLCVYLGYKHKYYVEVEVKVVWGPPKSGVPDDGSGNFPWDIVQIPERKLKYVTSTTKDVEFWVLRSDLKYAVIIPDYQISSSPLVEVPNSQVSSGERFIQVPIEMCTIRRLGNE